MCTHLEHKVHFKQELYFIVKCQYKTKITCTLTGIKNVCTYKTSKMLLTANYSRFFR